MFQKFKLKSTMSTEPTEDQLEELKTINCSINRENKYISDQSNIALKHNLKQRILFSSCVGSHGNISSGRKSSSQDGEEYVVSEARRNTHTQNDNEVAEEVKRHFDTALNNQRPVDWSTLSKLERKEILHAYDSDLTHVEFEDALTGITNGKASGENGVLPDLIKALKGNNRNQVFTYIKQFWDDEHDHESWHSGLLIIIHKAGKPKDDLNN